MKSRMATSGKLGTTHALVDCEHQSVWIFFFEPPLPRLGGGGGSGVDVGVGALGS